MEKIIFLLMGRRGMLGLGLLRQGGSCIQQEGM